MKFIDAFNALNVFVQTPKLRLLLLEHDPRALKQAEDTLAGVTGTDPVQVKTLMVAERLDNIAANFGLVPGTYIQAEVCNGHGFIRCRMRNAEEAMVFAAFVRVFVEKRASATVHGDTCFVEIMIDEDNA